jgi:predicted DNA-binding transcriptional regulator
LIKIQLKIIAYAKLCHILIMTIKNTDRSEITEKATEIVKRRGVKLSENPDFELIKRLENIGILKNEAIIYIFLLKYGKELGASKIALETKIHRQYVYLILEKLIKLGIVVTIENGSRSKYKALPPTEIEKIGRRRAVEAGDIARELNLISNIGNDQDFEVLQGRKAIQEYEVHYALSVKPESEEFILGGASNLFTEIMGDNLEFYLETKESKNIGIKYIGTLDEIELYKKYIGVYANQDYVFMDKLPSGKTHMVIRRDTVSFYSFLTPPLLYVIKSEVVAQNYKDFFMMLWNLAKKQ